MARAVDWLLILQERFQAKACPGLDPRWPPVRVKKTRQNNNLEPKGSSSLLKNRKKRS
jgi:hypothetical protein